jgi:predicted ATPase
VAATSPDEEIHQALLSELESLFEQQEQEKLYPYLGHLLSLELEPQARVQVEQLDPQSLQARYLTSLRKFLMALSGRRPLALILEDVHWADPSSTELLIKLLPLAFEAPILFCIVTRPERDAPGWKLLQAARETMGSGLLELNLGALTEEDSRKLVANLLEIEALPESIRELILEKSEGNPFFVEEVIRMLLEQGALTEREGRWQAGEDLHTIRIPDNLQSLLLARIDRLPEDARHLLRVASVIGRQFSVQILEQIFQQEAGDQS